MILQQHWLFMSFIYCSRAILVVLRVSKGLLLVNGQIFMYSIFTFSPFIIVYVNNRVYKTIHVYIFNGANSQLIIESIEVYKSF